MTLKMLSATASLLSEIRACTTCAAHLMHGVRPVVQFSATARLVIIGQAPGSRVHASGVPWDDASGDRLREWTGLPKDLFYGPALVALVPMGFCYPGKGPSGDLPPRPECAPKWHDRVMAVLPADRFTVLVGSYAQRHQLPATKRHGLARVVREYAPTDEILSNPAPVLAQRHLDAKQSVLRGRSGPGVARAST